MTSAARRASRASSSVQHPREPVRKDVGLADSARCTADVVALIDRASRCHRGVDAAGHGGQDPHGRCLIVTTAVFSFGFPSGPADTSPARRARSMAGPSASMSASMSARDDVCPARSEENCEPALGAAHGDEDVGRLTPAEQPSRSNTRSPARRGASAARPPRPRGADVCVAREPPLQRGARIAIELCIRDDPKHPLHEVVTQRPSRSALRLVATARPPLRRSRRPPARRPSPTAPRVLGRHRAAAVRRGRRDSSSAPTPSGPPNLCPATVRASSPLAPKSTGSWPTACTASECRGTPCARAIWASAAIGCTVPTSLFAHMTLTRATSSPRASAFVSVSG